MSFAQMEPWQLLLWIVALEIITLPLLVGFAKSIIAGYFAEKKKYVGDLARALGDTLSKAADVIGKGKEKKDE